MISTVSKPTGASVQNAWREGYCDGRMERASANPYGNKKVHHMAAYNNGYGAGRKVLMLEITKGEKNG